MNPKKGIPKSLPVSALREAPKFDHLETVTSDEDLMLSARNISSSMKSLDVDFSDLPSESKISNLGKEFDEDKPSSKIF